MGSDTRAFTWSKPVIGRSIRRSLAGLSVLLGTTALSTPLLADPDDCTVSGDYFCQGNQSLGFQVGVNSGLDVDDGGVGVDKIIVDSLTPIKNSEGQDEPYTGPFIFSTQREGSINLNLEIDMGSITHEVGDGSANVSFAPNPVDSGKQAPNLGLHFTGTATNKGAQSVLLVQSAGTEGAKGAEGPQGKPGRAGEAGGGGGGVPILLGPYGGDVTLNGGSDTDGAIDASTTGARGGDGGRGGPSSGFQQGGGDGGAGGSTGTVTLTTNVKTTVTAPTHAVHLVSSGGDGGNGGTAWNAGAAEGEASGGMAGDGGAGGPIMLDFNPNDGGTSTGTWDITTTAGARAIRLETVGGKGGDSGGTLKGEGHPGGQGGAGGQILLGDAARSVTTQGDDSVAVELLGNGGNGGRGSDTNDSQKGSPGAGGDGGAGSEINVSGTWTISANGTGIIAASQGGTGGNAGYNTHSPPKNRQGGTGGAGGTVGIVTSSTSTIDSSGEAIKLESFGGHGGYGSPTQGGGSNADPGPGGDGGRGGHLYFDTLPDGTTSAGQWTITTTGEKAYGIFMDSKGGYGIKAEKEASDEEDTTGKDGGNGGDGGAITIASGTRTITTSGSSAHGVVASSTGGVAGQGGERSSDTEGAKNGWSGQGGAGGKITIAGGFNINTSGPGAIGISATSTGADTPLIENSVNYGAPGNGGDIEISLAASSTGIKTTQSQAHGIFATSISGTPSTTRTIYTNAGAVGGDVTITTSNNIYVSGRGAHGIYASSQGFAGGSSATRLGVIALFNGKIDITVNEGVTVQGGTASDSNEFQDGAAIYVDAGKDSNTVENSGTIQSVEGSSGIAIAYNGSGSLAVNNNADTNAKIVGSICVNNPRCNDESAASPLATPADGERGEITLLNGVGAIVEAGERLEVKQLVNEGTLYVGGDGVAGSTWIDGDYIQEAEGELVLDLSADAADVLSIGGTMTFAPDATIHAMMFGDLTEEDLGTYDVLHAEEIVVEGLDGDAIGDILRIEGSDGYRFDVASVARSDGMTLQVTVSQVPLPASAWLLLSACAGFVVLRRYAGSAR